MNVDLQAFGADILFRTNAGILSNGTTNATEVIATTNSSGVAAVTLTLPSTAQTITANDEGPYGLGHRVSRSPRLRSERSRAHRLVGVRSSNCRPIQQVSAQLAGVMQQRPSRIIRPSSSHELSGSCQKIPSAEVL